MLRALFLAAAAACLLPAQGPPRGALLIIGGGAIGPAIWSEFARLAGGYDAKLVYIPTAAETEPGPQAAAFLTRAGFKNVTVLHTRDPHRANEASFFAPLLQANSVFFGGGRQWRLVDSYANTRTEAALAQVLERGGVIAGTSAGASIQASFLVRGARENNFIMIAPAYQMGFGYLANTAIDQHLLKRKRAQDLWPVILAHPELLGIGLDEATAISVQANRFTVLGASLVAIYDAARGNQKPRHYFLCPGTVFDLSTRRVVE
jgi:cyanophycinase